MAKFNEIQVGRYNRLLTKLLGIKGPAPAPQSAGEIMPTLPLFFGREMRILESWGTFAVTISAAAVAAQQSAIRFRNPAGSNIIAIIEKLVISNTNAVAASIILTFSITGSGPLANDVPTTMTNSSLDPRGPQSPAMLLSTSTNAGAVVGLQISNQQFPANTNQDFIVTDSQELPLLPGSQYTMYPSNLNQAGQLWLVWRERFLEEGERT